MKDIDNKSQIAELDLLTQEKNAEKVAELDRKRKEQVIQASLLLAHVQEQTTAVLSQSSNTDAFVAKAEGANKASLGGTNGLGDAQSPSLPPINKKSGAPDPSVPSDGGIFGSNGRILRILQKLKNFIEYIYYHPTDPAAVLNFAVFLKNLQSAGFLGNNDVQGLLGSAGVQVLLKNIVGVLTELSYFFGFDGQKGKDAATAYLNTLQSAFGGVSGPYINDIKQAIQAQFAILPQFDKEHFVDGKYIFKFGDVTYVFDKDSHPPDVSFIAELLYNQGPNGDPNSWFNDIDINVFNAEFRERFIEDLLGAFKGNTGLIIALILFYVLDQDSDANEQQSGLADTTGLLTKLTNQYINPLITDAKDFKDFTPKQVKDFIRKLFDSKNLVNIESQIPQEFRDAWNSAFKQISDIKVEFKDPDTGKTVNSTLGAIMKGELSGTVSDKEAAAAFASLVPTAPTPGSSEPPTSPGFSALTSALQQLSGLSTGQAKTVTTQVSTVTSLQSAIFKLGLSFVTKDGGGIVALNDTIIRNQKA